MVLRAQRTQRKNTSKTRKPNQEILILFKKKKKGEKKIYKWTKTQPNPEKKTQIKTEMLQVVKLCNEGKTQNVYFYFNIMILHTIM